MYIFNNYIALNMLGPMRTLEKKRKTNPDERKKKERARRAPPLKECL